jgi:hypothetical protein
MKKTLHPLVSVVLALTVALTIVLSVAQLQANMKITSAFFACVDHGCSTDADCSKPTVGCQVCAGDKHCALVP